MKMFIKCGKGRGKRTGHKTHAINCAKAVIRDCTEQGHNWRYNADYWRIGMKGHVESALVDGLDLSTLKEVVKAEALYKDNCEGKDCSFIKMEGVA